MVISSSLLAMLVAITLFFMGYEWVGVGVLCLHAVVSVLSLHWRRDRFVTAAGDLDTDS